MAEAQLKKLDTEKDRLQAELKTLQEAITTRDACEDLIRHVEKSNEPFSTDHQAANPWTNPSTTAQGCGCSVM